MDKNGTLMSPLGLRRLTYYDGIKRTSDLLKTRNFGQGIDSFDLLISNFFIAPATVNFDPMVEEAIFELNRDLSGKMKIPDKLGTKEKPILSSNLLEMSIEEFLVEYSGKNGTNTLVSFLKKNGFTGDLTMVASNINSSTIDQFTRAILSEESNFFYLAFKAIIGSQIKDVEGIGADILNSLGLVKSYINTRLVDKVIAKENLDVSDEEVKNLKATLHNRSISYASGNPEKTIVELVDDLKEGGTLFTAVMKFLNSGKVTLPRSTNKSALAQKMVDYLLKLGYNDSFGDDNQSEETPMDESEITPDDFQSIENVGPVTNEKFLEAGIFTFAHLAKFTVEDLKSKLNEPLTNINYESIITQAQMVTSGQFKKLIEYQDKLNKRNKGQDNPSEPLQ